MSRAAREWFSAQELADMALPGLPATKRGIQVIADREGWARTCNEQGPLARKRAGRGGGFEYHIALLPEAARIKAIMGTSSRPIAAPDRDTVWAAFETMPASVKTEAARRLAIIDQVDRFVCLGLKQTAAVDQVASDARRSGEEVSTRTIWGWLRRLQGVASADRLAYLAPAYEGCTARQEIPAEAWEIYKGDYLRLAGPTHAHCYRNLQRLAGERGWDLPSAKTFQRRLEAEVPTNVQTYCRQGDAALSHAFPHLTRDRGSITPMQVLNLDGHTWDVLVKWGDVVVRPHSLAVQDIASGKILAIRFDFTLNHHLVRLALGDAFREFGVCDTLLMDNGRENAAAAISGGQKRLRWGKTPEEDHAGLLKTLGVKALFATPYWGQAKPIERAFRNFAHDIAKRAEFEGAYTGHNPVSKPENYASRAVPFAEFDAIVRREIEFYNAQQGRQGQGMNGRSFDQVFAEGLQRRPVKRLSEAQLRLCMLASKPVSMDPRTGAVTVEGHRYWSPDLGALPRQKVTVRFDPERMDQPVAIYAQDGRLLAEAERLGAGSFDNLADGRRQRQAVREFKRGAKLQAKALRTLTAQDVAAQLASPAPPETPIADEKVVALVTRAPRRADQVSAQPTSFDEDFDRGLTAALKGLG